MLGSIWIIGLISVLVTLYFTLAVQVAAKENFIAGLVVLAIQVVVAVTAYQFYIDHYDTGVKLQANYETAYERGRAAGAVDEADRRNLN